MSGNDGMGFDSMTQTWGPSSCLMSLAFIPSMKASSSFVALAGLLMERAMHCLSDEEILVSPLLTASSTYLLLLSFWSASKVMPLSWVTKDGIGCSYGKMKNVQVFEAITWVFIAQSCSSFVRPVISQCHGLPARKGGLPGSAAGWVKLTGVSRSKKSFTVLKMSCLAFWRSVVKRMFHGWIHILYFGRESSASRRYCARPNLTFLVT